MEALHAHVVTTGGNEGAFDPHGEGRGEGMSQLDLDGRTKAEVAVERIRMHARKGEVLYFADSYGKDSGVVRELLKLSGVPWEGHHHCGLPEPPELLTFGHEWHPETVRDKPQRGIFSLVVTNGLPLRTKRWCCALLKERSGAGRTVVTGVRWGESSARRNRGMYETCFRDGARHYLNPIIDWTENDVWAFHKERDIPFCRLYREGFSRLGCVLCPNHGAALSAMEIERWPQLAANWRRAGIHSWERGTEGMKAWATGDAYVDWWLTRARHSRDESQAALLESGDSQAEAATRPSAGKGEG